MTLPSTMAPPTRTSDPSVIVPPPPELPMIKSTLELLSYGALGVLGVLKKFVPPAVQVPEPSAGGLPPPTDQSRSVPVLVMMRLTPVGSVLSAYVRLLPPGVAPSVNDPLPPVSEE